MRRLEPRGPLGIGLIFRTALRLRELLLKIFDDILSSTSLFCFVFVVFFLF